jgi:hypothetical protein
MFDRYSKDVMAYLVPEVKRDYRVSQAKQDEKVRMI